ncbi:hypothetical protein TREES_T100000910 [Tupaia chinensis]|uniref:Uncharacterized protein n=1 Tax=Tupaia chinensis TaxID=246437 RepID=L9JC95_TUPCH|nr:hypothetical protein TREES_T100000910 [Tupaia chinensis]
MVTRHPGPPKSLLEPLETKEPPLAPSARSPSCPSWYGRTSECLLPGHWLAPFNTSAQGTGARDSLHGKGGGRISFQSPAAGTDFRVALTQPHSAQALGDLLPEGTEPVTCSNQYG